MRIRLGLSAAAAVGLCLLQLPEAGAQSSTPIRNPYCQVPTFLDDYRVSPGAVGSATLAQSGPVIFIHRNAYQRDWYLRLTLAHECGHHVLGHVGNTQLSRWQKEMDADCWAARVLRQARDLHTLRAIVLELPNATKIGRPDEPSVPQRVQIIRQCSGV